ncbi:hypothetical protein BTM25_10850 [Actinomadura rubteroloni]|uniref:Uncharacterized protein n=1 Tax=Actinomadura rubteroloni TaxID=1926885 RepID=A0A2P4UNR2_9ACTN|nr:transcriptional regulator [Actinomadura rubteroloni]POM26681.1 hypothetical protein BTM25_10850 [Actinomadura rubteroloni]
MSEDYGQPPDAENTRRVVKQLLDEVRDAGGVQETLTIEWRGQPTYVQVVKLPVTTVSYNPGTRRIRAQRSYDPERDRALREDPWGPIGQDYLDFLLKASPENLAEKDPRFEELKESLRDFKQNSPGLITRDGVVVDGNTRLAALRELGVSHLRVGVLPESCTWDDVHAIELSLQLRKQHRREYSYINRLLAIDEQRKLGRPAEVIAREFRIRKETYQQDVWTLATLNELIERSENAGFRLRLMDFEDQQEKLRELHRRYVKESAVSQDAADMMKETRLAAIALKFSKTDVRLIEPDFGARYLESRLPAWASEAMRNAARGTGSATIPGLNRSIRTTNAAVAEARSLTDAILKARSVEVAADSAPPARTAEATKQVAEIRAAFDDALEPAGKDARVRKRKQAAQDRIKDACQDIEQCITDLVMARASRSIDEEAFDEAILHFRAVLGKLAAETARSIRVPGDGVSWLLSAVPPESR